MLESNGEEALQRRRSGRKKEESAAERGERGGGATIRLSAGVYRTDNNVRRRRGAADRVSFVASFCRRRDATRGRNVERVPLLAVAVGGVHLYGRGSVRAMANVVVLFLLSMVLVVALAIRPTSRHRLAGTSTSSSLTTTTEAAAAAAAVYATEANQRELVEVLFAAPSGLMISQKEAEFYCLLQHNVVSLPESYKRVFEFKDALSIEDCEMIIAKAESFAAENGGWTKQRHTDYPTTDLPLEAVLGHCSSIHGLVNGVVLPQIAALFGLNEDFLHIGELFVAKYEFKEGKQKGLGAHVDGTPWSFVVALNDPSLDFEGGGTFFVNENALYRPTEAGTAVLFSGKNLHSGVAITSGVRYILTGFCNYVEKDVSHENFLLSYDKCYDGSAAQGTHSGLGQGGIHTGDILRGVWVETPTLGENERQFAYQMIDGLNAEEVQALVRRSAGKSSARSSSGKENVSNTNSKGKGVNGGGKGGDEVVEYAVLVERQSIGVDGSGDKRKEARDDLMIEMQHEAAKRLATGKFFRFDDYIGR